MLNININDIAIINIKNVDYRCIVHNSSTSEAAKLVENSVLENCVYIKKYCLNFQSTQDSLFFIF